MIPILIDHARMPSEADLPPSLARLAFRNAIDVDQGRDFHPHVDRLIRGIEFHFQKSSAATAKPPRETTIPAAEPDSSPSSPAKKLTNSLGMTLVRIEPGSFLMGSSKDQIDHLMREFPDSKREWFDDEQPQHTVKITRPFYLGTHQVTQGQYQAVMGNNPSHFKGSDDLPVENVSWLDAVAFCNKLSEREKRTPFYRIDGTEVTIVGGNGYRLPTEAEWEYACRAEQHDALSVRRRCERSSASMRGTPTTPRVRPIRSARRCQTPGVFMICWGMSGNGVPIGTTRNTTPRRPLPTRRVRLGPRTGCSGAGAGATCPRDCRSAYRDGLAPGYRDSVLGFRVALGQSGC